jgi:hypothetical protein
MYSSIAADEMGMGRCGGLSTDAEGGKPAQGKPLAHGLIRSAFAAGATYMMIEIIIMLEGEHRRPQDLG